MDELDFYNPYDDYDEEDEGMILIEEKPRKRRKRKNPEPTTMAMPILLLATGYLAWCGFRYSQNKLWTWQPWQLAGKPRLQLRRTNPNNTEAERQARQQREFDRAIEQSLKPSVVTINTEVPWRPVYGNTEKERVAFIEP